MAVAANHIYEQYLDNYDDLEDDEDAESLASLETDDGENHPPEKIIAQIFGKNSGHIWYLVKWKDCHVLRSSWEGTEFTESFPSLLADWKVEKRRQIEGKSTPLDIGAFNKAVLD